jgi:uncharacterized protein (DUF885 family)
MSPAEQLAAIADEAWSDLVQAQPYYAATSGLRVERLPRGDFAQAQASAAMGRRRLERLAAVSNAGLDKTQRLTKATLAWLAQQEVDEEEILLTSFGVTPYAWSGVPMTAGMIFPAVAFDGAAEDQRYLSLLRDFAATIDAQRERVERQAAAGWRVPRPALANVRGGIAASEAQLAQQLTPSDERLAAGGPGLGDRIKSLIDGELRPAFQRLLAALGDDYEAAAPETVGMSQYPGGHEAYRKAIERSITWSAEPEELHATGLEQVARLAEAMRELRSRAFGFDGEEQEFHARLQADPRTRAATAEALEATYRGHLARMEPRIDGLFERRPKAAYDVARLAPHLEAGMTFGFYHPPETPDGKGIYYYSGFGLEDRQQINAAPLIFHELLPGHHFHITRQGELGDIPQIRRKLMSFTAFNEGWAEYSAGLGEELGLYEDPYDLYGWLTHQRFVSQRLVVDTGMNALGWSLEKGRRYMSANTLEGPTQVASETLRYSTDMPAQALGYRWGFLKFRELRQRARDRLGPRFDIRRWHEAILSQGGLPMTVLDQSLQEWETGEGAGAANVAS